ncbi:hypothetical protein HDU67_000079 [Dinochytrium kinnereticum]|nr:hypothetical protein HDU67_000079 [Dinochytrium kinnereticum]
MERERPIRAVAQAYVNRNYAAAASVERDPYADIPFWMPTTRWEKKWVTPSATNSMPVFGQKPSSHRAMVLKWVAVPGKKPENFEEDDLNAEEEEVKADAEEQDETLEAVEEPEDAPAEVTVDEASAKEESNEREDGQGNKKEELASISRKLHMTLPPSIRMELLGKNPDAATPPNSAVPISPSRNQIQFPPSAFSKITDNEDEDADAMESEETPENKSAPGSMDVDN